MNPTIVVVCDAGMGSSALGASLLKRELRRLNLVARVSNVSVDEDLGQADLVVTHHSFEERLRKRYPHAKIFGLIDFVSIDYYRKVIEEVKIMNRLPVLLKENIVVNCPTTDSDTAIRNGRAVNTNSANLDGDLRTIPSTESRMRPYQVLECWVNRAAGACVFT